MATQRAPALGSTNGNIPSKLSPNGKPLLVVSNETSGTTAILQIDLER